MKNKILIGKLCFYFIMESSRYNKLQKLSENKEVNILYLLDQDKMI